MSKEQKKIYDSLMAGTVESMNTKAKEKNITIPSKLRKEGKAAYLSGALIEAKRGTPLPTGGPRTFYNYSDLVYIKPPSFEIHEEDRWKKRLAEHGVCVIKTGWDPKPYREAFWDFLESCVPDVKRNKPKTWSLEYLPHTIRGMFKSYIGHQEFMWELREKSHDLFTRVWGTDDLLASFDGASFMLPKPNQDKFNSWFHFDQGRDMFGDFNPKKHSTDSDGMCSIQGVYFMTNSGKKDPGFCGVENSVTLHQDLLDYYPSFGHVWQSLDLSENKILRKQRAFKLIVDEGDMILFDSRLCHSTAPGYSSKKDSYRMVAYICMMPRANAKKEEIEKRIELYENNMMTGHWCYGKWFAPTDKEPSVFRRKPMYMKPPPFKTPKKSKISPLRRKLIGYSK